MIKFIATGELDVTEFISVEKLEKISALTADFKYDKVSDLKEKVGDEFTNSELNFALAHLSLKN